MNIYSVLKNSPSVKLDAKSGIPTLFTEVGHRIGKIPRMLYLNFKHHSMLNGR